MNVLVLGGGGREHALAWALKKSPRVKNLWCSPGNAGIAPVARCVALNLSDAQAVLAFLREKNIDLTVVGPEAPLVEGLADAIKKEGRKVFGPSRAAARLEGSKVFAKEFMKRHGIPTAGFAAYARAEEALSFVRSAQWPESFRVVKASGLAAGKGVVVCKNRQEVLDALGDIMVKRTFGAAGDEVVIEEALTGEELSVLALCDGETLLPLVPAQDHKRIFDNDQGPNTGGMGAYAPVPRANPATPAGQALWKNIEEKIFAPFLRGLKNEKMDYCGVIYFGLMLTPAGPKVLEFNVRFGDPETQVVLPMVENDWADLFEAVVDRRLKGVQLRRRAGGAVCVVLASAGYPGDYPKGKPIQGLDRAAALEDAVVFHAGTARADEQSPLVTSGGRVLGVTAWGKDLAAAQRRAYEAVAVISFDGMHYRRDIGAKAL